MKVNDKLAEAFYRRYKLQLSGVLESYSEAEASAFVEGLFAGLNIALQVVLEVYEEGYVV